MFFKFKFILLGLILWGNFALYAKPVSLEEAENVAKNWMLQQTGKEFTVQKASPSGTVGQTTVKDEKVRVILLNPKGWVVTSADDVVQPVLGYGESPIDLSSTPPGFKDWITNAKGQIKAALQGGKSPVATTAQVNTKIKDIADEWKRLKADVQIFKAQRIEGGALSASSVGGVVTPLLWMGSGSEAGGIIWGQGSGYNAKCPYDSSSQYDSHVLVGCVATAMGQIMRYYQSPAQGSGYHSYNDPNYGTLSADFGNTLYHWASMPYSLSSASSGSEIDAVSTILYHAGVAVDMGYGISVSLAYPNKVPNAIKTYFGYNESNLYNRDEYGGQWDSALQGELNNGRPLFYGGFSSSGNSGHAFVLDGYDGGGYYHFNWGWDGYANGYYSLGSLTPGQDDYTFSQLAVTIIASSSPIPPPPPPPGTVTRTEVTELYVATFLRAPDAAGLNYWVSSGLTIEGIASSFFDQPETQAKYPPETTIGEFVAAVYTNLFNRYPDEAGLEYWAEEIYYGRVSPSLFILAVINGAQGLDATILNNKTRVGEYYADAGLNNPECAEYVMWYIDETEQSVQDAFTYIDNGCSY